MRVVVEHPDGRRVGCEEADFDSKQANPFNHPRTIISIDAGDPSGEQKLSHDPGRDPSEHVSLMVEGFKIVRRINPDTGHEEAVPPTETRLGRVLRALRGGS